MRRMFSLEQLKQQSLELLASGNVPLIKGGEIVENMEGYSYASYGEITTLNMIYAGACKNGNKLTLVGFFEVTTGAEETAMSGKTMFGFTVPNSVYSKLYPSTESPFENHLQDFQIVWFRTPTDAKVGTGYIYKNTGISGRLEFNLGSISGLNASTKYLCRIESTFLLNENLVD